MRRFLVAWALLLGGLAIPLVACNGGDGDGDTGAGGEADVALPDAREGGADTQASDVVAPDLSAAQDAPPTADLPGLLPDLVLPPPQRIEELVPELTVSAPALDGPVRIVKDRWGVPHVYAGSLHDAFFAQGFAVASDRLVQMHAFRLAGAGRMAELPLMGPGELAGDVYMRTIDLRGAAEAIWAELRSSGDERSVAILEAFAEGVNAFVAALKDGTIQVPGDLLVLGGPDIVHPWTPIDSLVIARVQSWDLSFEGQLDELETFETARRLMDDFGGTALEGIVDDVLHFAPATRTSVLPMPAPEGASKTARPRPSRALAPSSLLRSPFYARIGLDYLARVRRAVAVGDRRRIMGAKEARGSNNWAVSGAHTASGHALLANDPHLTLRNPSIFYQNHLNTTRAGGDIEIAGVSFPGIPAMVLGRNAHVAWAATVYYADVTDIYLEEIVPATAEGEPDGVVFGRAVVPIETREELLRYPRPLDGCEAFLEAGGESWTGDYAYSWVEEDGVCVVTLQIEEVPHHGPIIPGSRGQDSEGRPIAMTWRWTGFEPSEDAVAVFGYNMAADIDEFLASAARFGVGSQNWLAIDDQGNIGYRAFMKVPRRPWTEEGAIAHPPWLPLPGGGAYEWQGYLPVDALPHAKNPESGVLSSCNHDGYGVTFDNDPFNDPVPFHAYMFDIGFRAERVRRRLEEGVAAGHEFTVADLQDIQADHHSPLGEHMTPAILAAIDAAEQAATDETKPPAGPCPECVLPVWDERFAAVRALLGRWSFVSESGAGAEASSAEREDSTAAAIFNVWVTMLTRNVFDNKGLADLSDQLKGRLLLRMFEAPESLATYDPVTEGSLLWDDRTTEGPIETQHSVVARSLSEALDWLADPALVGVADEGGFGTADMTAWRWGLLHVIKLTSPLGQSIPPDGGEWPDGYPRPGDRFCVDASHPKMSGLRFTFRSGPAMRAVYHMAPGAIEHFCVIPQGQSGRPYTKHYQDEMALWARNEAHPIPATEEALLPEVEGTIDLVP